MEHTVGYPIFRHLLPPTNKVVGRYNVFSRACPSVIMSIAVSNCTGPRPGTPVQGHGSCTGPQSHPRVVHYEGCTVGKRVVQTLLECCHVLEIVQTCARMDPGFLLGGIPMAQQSLV